jgi:Na+-translocating ferredoxin:NAD+ oxidoreductase RnfG subunit
MPTHFTVLFFPLCVTVILTYKREFDRHDRSRVVQSPAWMLIPVAAISVSAYATTYMTVEQAQAVMFPGAQLTRAFVSLTPAQTAAIEKKSGVSVRKTEVQAWKSTDGGYFLVDEAIGKHELFTVAVAVNPDSSIKRIEILDYKESYGYEVRNEAWRKQFTGKSSAATLKLGDDIKNISGATLSCRHVTETIKRLLTTYDVALKSS